MCFDDLLLGSQRVIRLFDALLREAKTACLLVQPADRLADSRHRLGGDRLADRARNIILEEGHRRDCRHREVTHALRITVG